MFVRHRMPGIIQLDAAADGKGWSLVTIRRFFVVEESFSK